MTSDTAIANAINSGTDFTATASSALTTKGFNAANDSTTAASATVNTGDAGSLKITSLVPGAVTPTVTFTEGNAMRRARGDGRFVGQPQRAGQ